MKSSYLMRKSLFILMVLDFIHILFGCQYKKTSVNEILENINTTSNLDDNLASRYSDTMNF
ncbi:hypothetical protein RR46_08818 [Papilio xuthus]|uniref:Uncharacterized protein n=1 Tax=Papilio xuthus TaxID=66420 RepID=A0A194PRI2_PAPXU|nr:hypothetical protein RR46_08818 [Papilio xuthus]